MFSVMDIVDWFIQIYKMLAFAKLQTHGEVSVLVTSLWLVSSPCYSYS